MVTHSNSNLQQKTKIEMIITDAKMPVMDGLEMIKNFMQSVDDN